MLSMAPDSGWPPLLLARLESHVPRSIQYAAAIIVALMVYTLILSIMLPSGDSRQQPRPEMTAREIMQAGLAQIADEVRSMEEHHRFLRSGEPLQPRVDNHRRSCTTWSCGSCNCNRGAFTFTFTEMDDVESQLLNTGTATGTKSIQRVKEATSIGLENVHRPWRRSPGSYHHDDFQCIFIHSFVPVWRTRLWYRRRSPGSYHHK
jgi:hypothetical protein